MRNQDRRPARRGETAPSRPKVNFEFDLHDSESLAVLYSTRAEEIAKTFVHGREGVSRNQIRRLFDECKRLLRKIDSGEGETENDRWQEVVPLVKLIKAKTAYAVTRASEKRVDRDYYQRLGEFIQRGIDQSTNVESYRRFVTLFEAVYAYYYAHGGSSK